MPSAISSPADAALQAALTRDLDEPPTAAAARLAEFLASAFGPSTVALIHYGSHAHRSDARPESAHDFFVIVDCYRDAYRALSATVGTRFSPAIAAALARVLPPNVVAVTAATRPEPLRAKCAVLTTRDLHRTCARHSKDHFAKGRLFQQAQLVWARDAASRAAATDILVTARCGTFDWARAALPPAFSTELYCRVLLERSFAAEIRPENSERIAALFRAQHDVLVPMYEALLQHLASQRILARGANVYRQMSPPDARERARLARYFARSKFRATARWFKYVLLYEGWLEYIAQKIARRGGVAIELSERERRWPLIFLWPKALRYLRSRPQRRG